jgi:hypothetical protein
MKKESQRKNSRPADDSLEADLLRNTIDTHLQKLGFSYSEHGYFVEGDLSKQRIRDFHSVQRQVVQSQNRNFIETYGPTFIKYFATGKLVNPSLINPELIEVTPNSLESRLFRFACLLWSVPVSRGFGRRIRFLVRDRQNGQLIGVFALGDPVFNLSARDNWIGWDHKDRMDRLVHVMDAYVLGALPPYSKIIGGKLIASLIGSKEVRHVYERKYLGLKSVISGKKNFAQLILLTTTSALGRSSIYNRLIIPNGPSFIRIGSTKGFGHFHLSGSIFGLLREYLELQGHPYASGNRFGMGPNWKIRVTRAALEKLGISGDSILKHGIAREVYAIPLANNWKEILLGKQSHVQSSLLPAAEIADYCLHRWLIPRASWDKRYEEFNPSKIMDCLLNGGPGPTW